ncbi:MAG: hypothetical protein DHS20C17_31810 [Cyclobacteriaceae bacterium]|nr:MAG: hypothetical protein DHS20C17_31810 [Cyclobacteriaceae bacterium]
MTRKIIIDGIIFNVEPVGHEILKAYLDAWKQLNPKKRKQWEELVAEHLLQQLHGGCSTTTVSHVESIYKVMPEIPFSNLTMPPNAKRYQYLTKLVFGLW